MKLEDLKELIADPFLVESLAPLGYQSLMASGLSRYEKYKGDRVDYFYANEAEMRQLANRDYDSPCFSSIPLSTAPVEFNDSISSLLFKRKSIRDFSGEGTDFETLSFLLGMSCGIKAASPDIDQVQHRTYPSGGELFTLRVYVDVRRVSGVKSGVYLFNPFRNCLELINDFVTNESRFELHNHVESLETIERSCFEIIISTQPSLSLFKYGEHGWKVILMEMGHLAQNIWLVGVGCGYSMYPCTSINISQSEEILRTSAKGELALYSLVVGR